MDISKQDVTGAQDKILLSHAAFRLEVAQEHAAAVVLLFKTLRAGSIRPTLPRPGHCAKGVQQLLQSHLSPGAELQILGAQVWVSFALGLFLFIFAIIITTMVGQDLDIRRAARIHDTGTWRFTAVAESPNKVKACSTYDYNIVLL